MNIYFGENLRFHREKRGMTQSSLADFIGVSFQTISKWERGETYPDITLLASIAEFFGVSVDDILGINKAENERKINEYLAHFDDTYFTDTDKLIEEYDKAISEFPYDFRILVRYMELITETTDHPFIKDANKDCASENDTNNPYELGFIKNPDYEAISQRMQSIYDNIQNHCTDDDIRIRSKRIMIKHLIKRYELSFDETAGKWRCDAEALERARKIHSTLPAISDTKECLAIPIYDDLSSRSNTLEETLEELLFHLQCNLKSYIYFDEKIPLEYKIEKIKSICSLLDILQKNDHINKNEIHLMLNYGQLSYLNAQIGRNDEAFYYLEKCIETAIKLDNNPKEMEKIARFYNLERPLISGTMRGRMKIIIMQNYPFPEGFKASEKFNTLIRKL